MNLYDYTFGFYVTGISRTYKYLYKIHMVLMYPNIFACRMDQIKSYLRHRHVDEKLQNRVKRWADYTWTR